MVNIYDFPQDAVGRAVPYGIYDEQHKRGTVYVGQSADTPIFAVDNIAHWCQTEMRERFPQETRLMIEADGGGSNRYRSRVWKQQLQVISYRPLESIPVNEYPFNGCYSDNPAQTASSTLNGRGLAENSIQEQCASELFATENRS